MPEQPIKVKHHITPASYLARFTPSGEEDGLVWVTNLEDGKQWDSTPRGIGFRNYFYSINSPRERSDVFEDFLERFVDTPSVSAFTKIHKEQKLPGHTEPERQEFIKFTTFMLNRTQAYKDFVFESLGTTDNRLFLKALGEQVVRDITDILRCNWCLWIAAPGEEFVSSDQPAIAFEANHTIQRKAWKLGTPRTVVTMPISRTMAIEARREPLDPPVRIANQLMVAKINGWTVRSAAQQVYSTKPEFLISYYDSSRLMYTREFLLEDWKTFRRGYKPKRSTPPPSAT